MDDSLTHQEITRRTAAGAFYKIAAQAVTLLLGFTRVVLLARILAPSDFGLVALALFFVQIFASLASFGLNAAFIQKETLAEADISTHFTLRASFSLLALLLVLALSPLFSHFYPQRPLLIPILLALSAVETVKALSATPTVLLTRRLQFKRLAVLDVLSSASMLLAAVALAWRGFGPWSLVLGEQLVGALVSWVGVWLFRPPWKPSLAVNPASARHFLSFGKYILATLQIDTFLDQFDDFWTATSLGSAAAGFYTKAYEFARYPRRVIIAPLQSVFYPTFARLKNNAAELSTAFFQITAVIIRLGFFASLLMVLAAPEVVVLLLTTKWLPMVAVFQWMVIYTLFDPIMLITANLLMAVGRPGAITRIKMIQLSIFIPTVVVSARLWGIVGVAIAADLMLVTGTLLILLQAKSIAKFSFLQLFANPILALLVGVAAGLLIVPLIPVSGLLGLLVIKITLAGLSYLLTILLLEFPYYRRHAGALASLLKRQ